MIKDKKTYIIVIWQIFINTLHLFFDVEEAVATRDSSNSTAIKNFIYE